MALDKLHIEEKVDNETKKKLLDSGLVAEDETLSANEVNKIVDKVNELVDGYNFGTPITAFNFKENVATYADLPLDGNEVNDGYGVLADGLVYVWNGTAFPSDGDGIDLGLKPSADSKVEEGNPLAVSGSEVYKKVLMPDKIGIDIISGNTNFIQELVGSSLEDIQLWELGAIWRTTGEKVNDEVANSSFVRTVKFYPIKPSVDYLALFRLSNNNYGYAYYSEEDHSTFISGGTSVGTEFLTTPPVGARFLKFSQRITANTLLLKFNNITEIKDVTNQVFISSQSFPDQVNSLTNLKLDKFGISEISENTNFIQELVGSSLSDDGLWGNGYLNSTGTILNGLNWYFTKKYYRLAKSSYDFNLFLTGNAKLIIYDLEKNIKEIISNPSGSDNFIQTFTFNENVLVRFSHRQSEETANRINLIKIVNRTNIYPTTINSENIEEYIPSLDNSQLRQIYKDSFKAKKKRPVVTLISDDGNPIDLEWYLPILNEYGVKSSFALIGNRVINADKGINTNSSITSEQARDLYQSGHDIASHTWTHTNNMNNQTLEEIDEELSKNKIFLEAITNDDVNIFVSPFGVRNSQIDNIVSRYYDANFITINGVVNTIPLDRFYMRRTSFDASESSPTLIWETDIKPAVDDCIQNSSWLIFAIHPHYGQYNSSNPEYLQRRNELRTLIEYCNANDVEITTAKKAYNYFKNHVDIGVQRVDMKYYKLGMDLTEINFGYFKE